MCEVRKILGLELPYERLNTDRYAGPRDKSVVYLEEALEAEACKFTRARAKKEQVAVFIPGRDIDPSRLELLWRQAMDAYVLDKLRGRARPVRSVEEGLESVRSSGLQPDTLVLPADHPDTGPYEGVVVIRRPGQESPLVGAFREGATVWTGEYSFDPHDTASDYFQNGLECASLRAWVALTIYRPTAFADVVA